MAPLRVCICGSGRTAQILAVLAASQPEAEVNVLCLDEKEAEEWNKQIAENDMVLTIHGNEGKTWDVKAKPGTVTTDASEAVPDCAIIIFATPANSHEQYLKAIVGHMDKKMAIVGMPGLPGFEFQCKQHLGELSDQVTIMSYQSCPWACKILEFGSKLEITKTFKELSGSMLRGRAIPRKPAAMTIQSIIGFDPILAHAQHPIELLFTSYSFLYPAIVYGKWKAWDGKGTDDPLPLLQSVDEETAIIVENCGKEYLDVAFAITAQKPEVDLSHIKDVYNWILAVYKDNIKDGTSLVNALSTNSGHPELFHEMTKAKTKYKPDFNCQYLTENVPYGMVVVRGVADILGVEVPVCNTVIEWCQEKIGKKYIVDGKLSGPDVAESRAPQTFGITTLEDLLAGRKSEN